jgi:hypothetical protein
MRRGRLAVTCVGAAIEQHLAVDHFFVALGLAAGAAGVGLVAVLSLLLGAFGSDFVSDFASGLVSDADSAADELLFEA